MAPFRSPYAGGYSDGIKRQLESVTLPDKIKCETCKKIRMQNAFSKRQLDILRNAIAKKGTKAINSPGYARCRNCVGGQAVEMRCSVCDQVKGLDQFAKAQRHNREMARCLACVQLHTEIEPIVNKARMIQGEEQDKDTKIGEEADESNSDDFKDIRGSFVYGDESDEDESIGGGVWLEGERDDKRNADADVDKGKGEGRMFTAFDQHGAAHTRRASISETEPRTIHSSLNSWRIKPGSLGSPSNPRRQPKKEPRFAKIRAYKPPREEIPIMRREPEPAVETAHTDEEDSDGDIEDYL